MEGCQSERIDWTCKHCKAHRYQCVECGDSVIEDGEGGELCEACFRTPRTAAAEIERLRAALKAALAFSDGWFFNKCEPSGEDMQAEANEVVKLICAALDSK